MQSLELKTDMLLVRIPQFLLFNKNLDKMNVRHTKTKQELNVNHSQLPGCCSCHCGCCLNHNKLMPPGQDCCLKQFVQLFLIDNAAMELFFALLAQHNNFHKGSRTLSVLLAYLPQGY